MLYDDIIKQYKEAEPIFVSDIKTDSISRAALTQQLGTLCRRHVIEKFDDGVYFIPKKTRFMSTIGPTSDTVARYKYISNGKRIMGFYSGYTFANLLGISRQVPHTVEIVSNNTSAIIRTVIIGKQKFIIRKPVVEINEDNVYALQLLDIMKDFDKYTEDDYRIARGKVKDFIDDHKIKKTDIDEYIRNYPISVFKYYYELELEHVFA